MQNKNINNIIKIYKLNFINEILQGKKNLLQCKIKNKKITYKTLYKDGQATNYNKIIIELLKKHKQQNKIKYSNIIINIIEFETMQKDIYKLQNIQVKNTYIKI